MHVNVETQMLLVSERTMSPTGLLTLSASCNRSNCLRLTTTSHYYLDIVDVDCPVVLLTVFMTALFSSDLHKWFFVKEKSLHLLCVFSCLSSKNVLKFSKKLVLKFYFVLLGPLKRCNFVLDKGWSFTVALRVTTGSGAYCQVYI